jgi:hypothetical protein
MLNTSVPSRHPVIESCAVMRPPCTSPGSLCSECACDLLTQATTSVSTARHECHGVRHLSPELGLWNPWALENPSAMKRPCLMTGHAASSSGVIGPHRTRLSLLRHDRVKSAAPCSVASQKLNGRVPARNVVEQRVARIRLASKKDGSERPGPFCSTSPWPRHASRRDLGRATASSWSGQPHGQGLGQIAARDR